MAEVVSSYVSNNRVSGEHLPELIRAVYTSLATAGTVTAAAAAKVEPLVEVRKSVFADHLVCLTCGQRFSMIKRHLRTEHNLSVEEYRVRYDLACSYPLVAPNYAKVRSALAKKIGLGRKSGERPPAKMAARKKVRSRG